MIYCYHPQDTTRSARELMPLVEGFGQDVRVTMDRSNGRPARAVASA